MGKELTSETRYSGTYERSIDAKKRVAIPSPWIGGEGDEFHVIPHPNEGYLMVMPPVEFDRWEQRIQDSEMSPTDKRRATREFYSNAHRVVSDKQGRILLPDTHCAAAGLNGEVIFVGARSRFEIWAKDRRQATSAENTAIYQRVADAIGL